MEKELKPKGIHFKMDWDEMIMDLEDASVGKLIKNSYNYLNNRELIEMDKMETMLFKHTIRPVLEYNADRYQKQVEHNRQVASMGGRKPNTKETRTNPVGLIETQDIPSGSFINPENPKDKDIVKDKSIDKEKVRTRLEIDKMKKLVELDVKNLKANNEIEFTVNVKELVRILGWTRFEILIFHTYENKVESLLSEYDELGCLQGILVVKQHYSYFIDSIIK